MTQSLGAPTLLGFDSEDSLQPPDWLGTVLICSRCKSESLTRTDNHFFCPGCRTPYPIRGGVLDMLAPDLRDAFRVQQETWRALERARGGHLVSAEELSRPPQDELTVALLKWLRDLLSARGACRALELGAGRGWASQVLAEDGHEVVASDLLDDDAIGLGAAVAQQGRAVPAFGRVLTGAEALPFRAGCFDCVFCFATLRHIVDLERVFLEVARVLRPDGVFLALNEPFRGVLTTSLQRLQDCYSYKVARWWLPGPFPSTTTPEFKQVRATLGSIYYDGCRRARTYLDFGSSAKLDARILPASVLLASDRAEPVFASAPEEKMPPWLDCLAGTYGLEREKLHGWIQFARSTLGLDLASELLAHWLFVGNGDAVLVACKDRLPLDLPVVRQSLADCRLLDALLVACSGRGFVPIYGFHRAQEENGSSYHWIQPHAGFLIGGSDCIEVTLVCPSPYFRSEPVRIEIRLEDEQLPTFVFVIKPGKKVTVKIPLPGPAARRPALLVRISANIAFVPSDFNPGQIFDARLLALQLWSVRSRPVSSDAVQELLSSLPPAA